LVKACAIKVLNLIFTFEKFPDFYRIIKTNKKIQQHMSTRRNFIKKTIVTPVILFAAGVNGISIQKSLKTKPAKEKIRIIIETDAGGDPDDEQSMVRFLVYANEFDIEGIIANRPVARTPENKNPVRDGLGIVQAMVKAYNECYPTLVKHDENYPLPEIIMQRTVAGYNDTSDGVDLIISAVDSPDPRPVWFCNWGTDQGSGESCLKRALDKVMAERGPDGYARFKNRLWLSTSDKFGDHTGKTEPPFSIWVDTFRPEIEKKRWYHMFSDITARAGGFDIERDVRKGHGPLGAMYPLNTNRQQKEGDTMSFLYMLPYGLSNPDKPGWGSWGGRYGHNPEHPGKYYYWANQEDEWNGSISRNNVLARWAEAFQNDFRARMDWCVKPYEDANHHPVAVVNGSRGTEIIQIRTKPGKVIKLDAGKSYDPDGRKLIPEWIYYREAGTCSREISLTQKSLMKTSFVVPEVEKPETAHILFILKNDGYPALYSYRRILIDIVV
jgi:hypothetical protein